MAATLDMPPGESLAGASVVDSASITPPHSANGKKEAPEGVPSELSDLELDHQTVPASDIPHIKKEEIEEEIEEIEDIEPDHYYGGGKIPVFKPVSATHAPAPGSVGIGDLATFTGLCNRRMQV
jgi:hypothetical protein